MRNDHIVLRHHLELTNLERAKYNEQFPTLVGVFRHSQRALAAACQAAGLRKLEQALNTVTAVSDELGERQSLLRLLREDNVRLKILVKQVAADTQEIMNTVNMYFDRRSDNKDAINMAHESIARTNDRIAAIEGAIISEREEWEEDFLTTHFRLYELERSILNERDLIAQDTELSLTGDDSAFALRKALSKMLSHIEDLKKEYSAVTELISVQNKINLASKLEEDEFRKVRMSDLEKWALQLENPYLSPSDLELEEFINDEDLAATTGEEEFVRPDKNPSEAVLDGLSLLFGNEHSGGNTFFDRKEWEGVLGTFDSVEELQQKIKALLEQESHLNNESQKLKRAIQAKNRKVEKLKKQVQEITDDTRSLQQECDGQHNILRDLEGQEAFLREQATAQLQQLLTDTTEEQDRIRNLRKELQTLENTLAEHCAKMAVELADLDDLILNKQNDIVLLQDNIQIEKYRELIMLSKMDFLRCERGHQDQLRTELLEEERWLTSRMEDLEREYTRLLLILRQEHMMHQLLYNGYTSCYSDMAIFCMFISEKVYEAEESLNAWDGRVHLARVANTETWKKLDALQLSIAAFSKELETDLCGIQRAFIGYKLMGKICKSYVTYVVNQTTPAVQATESLLTAIWKCVKDRPEMLREISIKQQILNQYTGILLNSGTIAGQEYQSFSAFLCKSERQLGSLLHMASQTEQYLDLTKTQCKKLTDIAERFAYHFLRNQTSLFDSDFTPIDSMLTI